MSEAGTSFDATETGAGETALGASSRFALPNLTPYRQKLLINLVALFVICAVIALLTERFLTVTNLTNVLRNVAPVVIVGTAFTMLMVARGLDLSVGSVIALSGSVAALSAAHLPLPLAFLAGALSGVAIGVVNALLAVGLRINSVIATLGTLYVARGIAFLITDGVAVYGLPREYRALATSFAGISLMIWIMLAVVAIFIVLERFTLLGRYSAAVGSNPEAAYLAGVPGRRVQALLYVLTGTMAGIAAVLLSSRLGSGQPNLGVGFEFEVIVATVLGGTSLAGGEGTVAGMFIGALIVGVLKNGLNLLGVPAFWQIVAQGVVLVLAVALDISLRNRFAARVRRAEARKNQKEG